MPLIVNDPKSPENDWCPLKMTYGFVTVPDGTRMNTSNFGLVMSTGCTKDDGVFTNSIFGVRVGLMNGNGVEVTVGVPILLGMDFLGTTEERETP